MTEESKEQIPFVEHIPTEADIQAEMDRDALKDIEDYEQQMAEASMEVFGMTAYEELREKIAEVILDEQYEKAVVKYFRDGCLAVADRILSIIAERCWLKDETKEMPFDVLNVDIAAYAMYNTLYNAGWRPVKEIKKES